MRRFPMQACLLFAGVAVTTLTLFLMPLIGDMSDKQTASKLKREAKPQTDARVKMALDTALQGGQAAASLPNADGDLQQASVRFPKPVAETTTAAMADSGRKAKRSFFKDVVLGLRTDASVLNPMHKKLVQFGLRLTVLTGLLFAVAMVRSQ